MDISRNMAQEIIDELGGILNQQLNFFDARGYILASAHPERVGSYHAGAARLIREGLDELSRLGRRRHARFSARAQDHLGFGRQGQGEFRHL